MPRISSRFRQAGYIVVISPIGSTRCSWDPGCTNCCRSITAVNLHSTDLVGCIILANILDFKFHFALVPHPQTLPLLKIEVTLLR